MLAIGTSWARAASVIGALCGSTIAGASLPAVRAHEPDPKAVLSAAREAVTKLKALSCVSVFESVGGPEKSPSRTAEFNAQRVEAGGWSLHVKGSFIVKAGDGKGGADGKDVVTTADGSAREFEIGYDSMTARSLREADKAVVELTTADLNDLRLFFSTQDAGLSVPWELIDAKPLPVPDGSKITLGAATKIGDAACDVVTVEMPAEGPLTMSTRYSIATSDHLPRKIEHVRTVESKPDVKPGAGANSKAENKQKSVTTVQSLTLTELKADELVPGSMFVISVPDGYMVKAAGPKKVAKKADDAGGARRPPEPRESGLLAIGSEAPAWTLKNSDAKDRTLAGYRGKVVVMDFWGTWCPWCVKAMPAIQKVHEKFKDKPVAILGMNYEGSPTADPMAFMKKHGFTYEVIYKAETIAEKYRVQGWPTLYVIGADGKILFSESGLSPDLEAKLTDVIEKGLKDTGL